MNRKQKLIARQQELLNAAKAANREMTAEEQKEWDDIQRQLDALEDEPEGKSSEADRDESPESPESPEAIRAAERKRCADITAMCREFNIPKAEIDKWINDGTSTEAVREAIINKLIKDKAPIPTRGTGDINVGDSGEDRFRRDAADALLMRSGMSLDKPGAGAKDLMHMSLRDLAIETLEMAGEKGANRKSSDELYTILSRQFFNPTAAFPSILDNAINKAYVEGHKKVAVTFDQWTKKGSLKDFKIHDNNYLRGPAGEFLEVPEGAELKHDIFGDEKLPIRRLKTYGRQFTLTRQAFINDDIELVTSIPARYAASARKTINKQVYEILINNPAVYDGIELFASDHSNLVTTGTGITQDAMRSMIIALQNQLDEFGDAIIIRPETLLVPAGLSFDIYTLFNSPYIETSDNTQAVNPLYRYANSIRVIEDPTINVLCGRFGNTMPWFLLGARDDTDFIEVDYLNGQEIPTIRRMETPGQLGFVWDIYLDWGISVMDYRGAIKNPGIVVADPLE